MVEHNRRLRDVLPQDDGSAQGTLNLILKGFKSLGLPSWHQVAEDHIPGMHWYCYTSDCGSDQVAAKTMIARMVQALPNVVFFPMDCLEHQMHLLALGSLKRVDKALASHGRKWRYFSSIAKLTHLWRDLCAALYAEWITVHGHVSANAHARKLIPRCAAGRWQSVEQ